MIAWMTFALVLAAPASGDVFHVSADGNDRTGDGSAVRPWRTLQAAADRMKAGDTCLVGGGTYRETVRPKDGQTFRARPSEFALITGCDVVTGWKPRPGAPSILEAPVNASVRAVFLDGARQQLARHPNEDGDPFSTTEWMPGAYRHVTFDKAGTGTITFEGEKGYPPDLWVGGFYSGVHGKNCYNSVFGRIVASNDRTLTLNHLNIEAARRFPGFIGEGRGYVINHRNALDAPGEWHWERGTLSFHPPSGAKTPRIEAQIRLWGFDLTGRTGVTLEGLHFKAASVLMENATNCAIDRCTFRYHAPWGSHYYKTNRSSGRNKPYGYGGPIDGTSGIHITGTGNAVRNTYIAHAWGAGINVRGDSCVVENCFIEDVGWIARQCSNPIMGTGRGHRILRNTIRRTASTGIRLVQIGERRVKRPRIELNDIRDTGLVLVDGGSSAIYLSNHDSPTDERTLEGGVIARNVIGRIHLAFGNKGFGIYLDDGTDHATIHRNVIHAGGAIRWGIFLHYAKHIDDNITVTHNTVWGYREHAVAAKGHPKLGGVKNVVIRNNHAEKGGFVADVVDHNRADVPAAEFENIEAFDFRIRDSRSASRNAGVRIEGETVPDGKPDLGAYEFDSPEANWKAGSSLEVPSFSDVRR